MVSINTIILGGHLGAAPEERRTQGGKAMCTFRLATNRWDSRTGEEATEWHSVVCFEKQAESCAKYLQKGSAVIVEGRLQARQWEGSDGKKQTFYEVVGNRVTFLGRAGQPPPSEAAPVAASPTAAAPPSAGTPRESRAFSADMIPF